MKTLALAVTMLLMVALLVPAVAKDMPDVPFGHWAYDAVDELTDLGVVEGYPDGTFKGDRTWTRYEFAVMLTRMIDFLEDYLDSKVDRDGYGHHRVGGSRHRSGRGPESCRGRATA